MSQPKGQVVVENRKSFDSIRALQVLRYREPGREDDCTRGFRVGQVVSSIDGALFCAQSVEAGNAKWVPAASVQ